MSSHQTRTQSAQFKVRPLIGAIALALAAPAAFAAAPAAGALPGTFYTNVTGTSYSGSGASAAITYSTTSAAVMQWGATFSGAVTTAVTPTVASGGTAMNNVAGFNIGAGATLNITNGTSGAGLLISDVTGQASQIYGTVSAGASVGPLFIANANGVVLDANGAVNNGANGVAFLGFAQDAATFGGTVSVSVPVGQTLLTKGDVTVNGAVSAGTVLVAGAGNVNVSSAKSALTTVWNIVAGENFTFDGSTNATTNGAFAGGSAAVVNLAGGASSTAAGFSGAVVNAAGNVNLSNYVTGFTANVYGTFTNNGELVVGGAGLEAGAIVNNGEIDVTTSATNLMAGTGNVTNNGIIKATAGSVTLAVGNTNTQGSVINNGSILNAGKVTLSAGSSAGTAANNGTINFATSGAALTMSGFNVNLYGTVNANNASGAATALSTTSSLGAVSLSASSTAGGLLNLGTMLFASGGSTLTGAAVRVVSGGGLTDGAGVTVNLGSGPVTSGSNTYGYNLSVFNGATLSAGTAGTVTITGSTGASGSNINLDGTVAGSSVGVQANNINGLGGFNIADGGTLVATFSGNFNAPNGAAARSGAGNFLYNYVPVNVASNGTATIALDPTNTATAAQLVNVLVNGSATLASALTSPVAIGSSIVAQSSAPNSHLVVQATGNLNLGGSGDFYWPGLMYVGNINAGQPGSLSTLGTITLGGNVSNVIQTNVASEGGIWFMTNNPLNSNGKTVLTNTNSWINFPAATGFVAAYGAQNATSKTFYGMAPNATVNTILNANNVLASNMFYGR